MKKWKGLLLFLLFVLTGNAFPQGYDFRNFSSEDGLAQSYIYTIIQDVKGYLWIGTGDGLSRYNGFTFENFSTKDSLSDNFITCSITDGASLWFGHMNGGISYYDGKLFSHVNNPMPAVSHITHFAKSPHGRMWVSTYSDGLFELKKDTGVVKHKEFKDQEFITTFEFIDDDELLAGTNSGLLYCRVNGPGEIEIIRRVTEIPESRIAAIKKMRNGPGFYVATENDGVFQIINTGKQFKVSGIVTDGGFDFTGIQDIQEDNKSDLWLSTFGNGLIKLSYLSTGKLKSTSYFNAVSGFATSNVKTVFEDREGIIWSGNYGEGLTRITTKTFSLSTIDKQTYGNNIFSMWFDNQFRWLGTENGLVKSDLLTGKIIKFYSKTNGLPKDTVTAVYSVNGKELWIGTAKNGVYRMDVAAEKIIKFDLATGTLENSVNAIAGRENQVWIGTKKGLYNVNAVTGGLICYTINNGGLPHNNINCLYIDATGKLWVTTRSNILAYIENDKVIKIPLNSAGGLFTLGPVTQDADSRIWVGSAGSGVFIIESDTITNLTVKQGLLSDYCYSIISDNNYNIWVGHKGGLSKVKTNDFLIKPVHNFENTADIYQFNPNAVLKDEQKKIWFGTDKGLIVYEPLIEYQGFVSPILVITSFKVNDNEMDYDGKVVLSPGKYKIKIDFLGISLKEPALVTYQYKMEGYDNWSEITKSTTVVYNNMTEGRYTFLLNASSGDGAVTDNALIINIIIKKPLWKHWWFYVAVISLLFILIIIYIKRREYRFHAEKKILEEKVVVRTQEIQLQKNEIVLQRDIIDEKNASITASIRYASHIQNSILPPLELINKLFPENFILFRPKDIVSGDFYWMAERDEKTVFTVADSTGHGVPGAFMSFLGITLLNSLVNIQGLTRSDVIVTKLRERVAYSLQQGRKDIPLTDGMDIALCVLDRKEKKIQYTGGMNNLVYIRDGKLEVVKADRFSVCAAITDPNPFTLNEIEIKEGDVFYLFTDGYKDQFGGDFDKKYLVPHFYLTLLEIHKFPMSEQRKILDNKLVEWMKGGIQTDDVTVFGIRL
jgi:ligand-binding sensor domain-containing protein/serine phosphatase RsbU (regulator of sigma subunit)